MNFAQKKFLKGFSLSFLFLLLFLFFVFEADNYLSPIFALEKEAYLGSVSIQVQKSEEIKIEPVADVEEIRLSQSAIDAKSAFCIETDLNGNQKIIFQKDKNLKLPIASLTKLMTALVVSDSYDLSKEILLTKDILPNQIPLEEFKPGEIFSAETLLRIMLIESNNKAAYILSSYIGNERFIYLMNEKAKTIGLENTFFSDTTGLDENNISTAEDLAKLIEYILKNYPEIAKISVIKDLTPKNFRTVANTNQLLPEFPNTVLSKTGFTNEANGCLIMAVKNGQDNSYSINIILGADDRFLEMKKIINKNIQ